MVLIMDRSNYWVVLIAGLHCNLTSPFFVLVFLYFQVHFLLVNFSGRSFLVIAISCDIHAIFIFVFHQQLKCHLLGSVAYCWCLYTCIWQCLLCKHTLVCLLLPPMQSCLEVIRDKASIFYIKYHFEVYRSHPAIHRALSFDCSFQLIY